MKREKYEFFHNNYPKEVEEVEEKFEENPNLFETFYDADLLKEMSGGDELLEKLCEDVIENAYRYAEILFEFNFLISGNPNDREEAQKWSHLDTTRKVCHDALIDSIAIFSRNLEQKGRDNSIFKKLGSKENRVAYGNFALGLTYKELLKEEIKNDNGNG